MPRVYNFLKIISHTLGSPCIILCHLRIAVAGLKYESMNTSEVIVVNNLDVLAFKIQIYSTIII